METQIAENVDRVVAWSYAPGDQLIVIATGLVATVGGAALQVMWLLALVVAVLRRLSAGRTAATVPVSGDSDGDSNGDGGTGAAPGPGLSTR